MKICGTCEEEKDDGEFHKRAASADGLAAKCRGCQSDYDKARADDPGRALARKAYSQTKEGKVAGSRAKKKWAEKNVIKRAANVIVGNAIRDGRLTKAPRCEECWSLGTLHGHHDDYAKPLDVRWLCDKCHNDWHKENGPGLNG